MFINFAKTAGFATGKVLVADVWAMPKGTDPIKALSPEKSDFVSILRTGPFTFKLHKNTSPASATLLHMAKD